MSLATIRVPLSSNLVFTFSLDNSSNVSLIGLFKLITFSFFVSFFKLILGKFLEGFFSHFSINIPFSFILPTIFLSPPQETPILIGKLAPCLGNLITLTSWQKYFPPN